MELTTLTSCLAAALAYAERGWWVFPVDAEKKPLTKHGFHDSNLDEHVIREWWRRWPWAQVAVATGAISGLVVLDIDIDPVKKKNGFPAFAALSPYPIETPTSRTPRGGCHLLFSHPGFPVPSKTGKPAPALDTRADGGYVVMPPAPGRHWDTILGPDTPLAPMPEWMVEPVPPRPSRDPAPPALFGAKHLARYGEAALDNAVLAIITAPDGQQEATLNRQGYSIGRLVRGGVIPAGLALDSLLWAGMKMRSYDPRRPWTSAQIERKVRRAFSQGQASPRGMPHG
jgi:putative DNA primase/helicase